MINILHRRKPRKPATGQRPQMVLATGLMAAVLDPDRYLARQRWPWNV